MRHWSDIFQVARKKSSRELVQDILLGLKVSQLFKGVLCWLAVNSILAKTVLESTAKASAQPEWRVKFSPNRSYASSLAGFLLES